MATPRSRRVIIIIVLVLLLGLMAAFFARCAPHRETQGVERQDPDGGAEPIASAEIARPNPGPSADAELISEASVEAAPTILAGAELAVRWSGPANPEDYITIVKPAAEPSAYDNYKLVATGNPVDVTAPITAGAYEVRYVTGKSKQVLARAPLEVTAAAATLEAPAEALLGSPVSIGWTGPNNKGDYVTIVAVGTPDGRSANYAFTERGPRLEVNAPVDAGPAEIRYMTGQDNQVLARRGLQIKKPEIRLRGPDSVVESGDVSIHFEGPTNRGDYITVVPKALPDGRYGNNNDVSRGSPLTVQAPGEPGEGEIRYMTAQGARVLARYPIAIVPAEVTLEAPESAAPGESVEVVWAGPRNRGDYLTIVPASAPAAQVGRYADVHRGTPSRIAVPMEKGPAEIRYVGGQGRKILGRRPIEVK